jgi:hypothetical protein
MPAPAGVHFLVHGCGRGKTFPSARVTAAGNCDCRKSASEIPFRPREARLIESL